MHAIAVTAVSRVRYFRYSSRQCTCGPRIKQPLTSGPGIQVLTLAHPCSTSPLLAAHAAAAQADGHRHAGLAPSAARLPPPSPLYAFPAVRRLAEPWIWCPTAPPLPHPRGTTDPHHRRARRRRAAPPRVALYFLGGADDREALALATHMAEDAAMGLAVFRFMLPPEWRSSGDPDEDRLDEEALQEFVRRWVNGGRVEYSENLVGGTDEMVAVIRKTSPAHRRERRRRAAPPLHERRRPCARALPASLAVTLVPTRTREGGSDATASECSSSTRARCAAVNAMGASS
ncbi:hypothetical protein ACP4OV_031051 [Aristida adscensionis]